jgi:hypothetical protein
MSSAAARERHGAAQTAVYRPHRDQAIGLRKNSTARRQMAADNPAG